MTSNESDKAQVNGIHANIESNDRMGFDNTGAITEDEGHVNEKLDTLELNKLNSARTSVTWSEEVIKVRFNSTENIGIAKAVVSYMYVKFVQECRDLETFDKLTRVLKFQIHNEQQWLSQAVWILFAV